LRGADTQLGVPPACGARVLKLAPHAALLPVHRIICALARPRSRFDHNSNSVLLRKGVRVRTMTVLRCQLGSSSISRSLPSRRGSPVSTPVSRSPFSAPLSQKSRALHFARVQQYAAARQAFQSLLAESPDDVKAWISWAQVRFLCCLPQEAKSSMATMIADRAILRCQDGTPSILCQSI
jgi:hypothetical protein